MNPHVASTYTVSCRHYANYWLFLNYLESGDENKDDDRKVSTIKIYYRYPKSLQ